MKNILFVCTGNTCRSPMAMAILRQKLFEKGVENIAVDSAGLSASGSEISDNAVKALAKIGIDLNNYRSKQITADMVLKADLIVAMTKEHKEILLYLGAQREKVLVLADGVLDPFGGDTLVYEKCLSQIADGIDMLFEKGVIVDF